MPARFILSFDCEGKWGVADNLTARRNAELSLDRLRRAYRDVLAVLDEFGVAASFAFVGTFSLDAERLRELLPALQDLSRTAPGYLDEAVAGCGRKGAEGWVGDWAVEAVANASTSHELALHGATHLPWDWPGVTADVARDELGLLFDARAPLLERTSTYIYPRNAVAHREVLDEFGIVGARDRRGRSSRVASLLAEFDVWTEPDADPPAAVPVRIPAGHYINWRHGARRAVPVGVSRVRARRMLERAAQCDGVVHYWTHPENIAAAPGTLELLRGIVEDVARMRDGGRCEVLTQDDYCRRAAPERASTARSRRDALLAPR